MAFELNQQIFAWLCIYPATSSLWVKRFNVSVTVVVLITELLAEIASALFIYEFVGSDFENCLYALFQVAALFSVIYMWLIAFILRETIYDIFTKFQQIYDSSNYFSDITDENTSLAVYLNEANVKITWSTKALAIFLPSAFLVILTTMGIINISYCLLVYGHIVGDRLYFPYYFILPWNQRTLCGWIGLNLLSAGAASFYMIIDYSILSFFVGICEYHHVFPEFFGVLMNELDHRINSNANQFKDLFVKLIYFHNTARGMFSETADFFSLFIFIQLACSVIYLACSIFLTDIIMQHFDLSIGVLCSCVFISGSNLFLYCYYGGRATIDIVSYSNLLFESAWFKLPIEFQKLVIVMIANAQIPIDYDGFGVARLNL
ncbi:uncharacterized protein LOC129573051, partial [Sitodiplosis mosellana]|uniref:uncharacterized protein LOC129573051 n=1 Tax=Sitodiplosis mosellana TaxID=263140 RepID=UPI0024442A0B